MEYSETKARIKELEVELSFLRKQVAEYKSLKRFRKWVIEQGYFVEDHVGLLKQCLKDMNAQHPLYKDFRKCTVSSHLKYGLNCETILISKPTRFVQAFINTMIDQEDRVSVLTTKSLIKDRVFIGDKVIEQPKTGKKATVAIVDLT